jgi:amidase
MLQAMAGADPRDPASIDAAKAGGDFLAGLAPGALRGVRVGVMRFASDFHPETGAVFSRALEVLRAQGAVLVEVRAFPNKADLRGMESLVLRTELKADLNAYLASTDPARVPSRTLAALIAFDREHAAREMPLFGQATAGVDDPAYVQARTDEHRFAGPEGIDAMLVADRLQVLVAPTLGPSWLIDPVLKDRVVSGGAGGPAAQSGYPHLTVPMGQVDGLPVGLSFIGTAWSDARLLAYGYAYEQASHARQPPTYAPTASPPAMHAPG